MSAAASAQPRTVGQAEFVESAGLVFEQFGLTRMAGRVVGWLLICDPPHQSAGQIADALAASAGSISGTTRLLIRYGLIERVALPGQRRDYFRLRPGAWWQAMQERLVMSVALRDLAEAGLRIAPAGRDRLEHLRDFFQFLEEFMGEGIERWRARMGVEAK